MSNSRLKNLKFKSKLSKKLANCSFVLSFFIAFCFVLYNVLFDDDLISLLYALSGIFALLFFHLSIIFSLWKFKATKTYPRLFGIFSGIWAILHFLVYFVLSRHLSFAKTFHSITNEMLEFSGFVAFAIMFFMLLSSFKKFKKLQKVRKLGYFCLILASFHFLLSAKEPSILNYLALCLACFYAILRYFTPYLRQSSQKAC